MHNWNTGRRRQNEEKYLKQLRHISKIDDRYQITNVGTQRISRQFDICTSVIQNSEKQRQRKSLKEQEGEKPPYLQRNKDKNYSGFHE